FATQIETKPEQLKNAAGVYSTAKGQGNQIKKYLDPDSASIYGVAAGINNKKLVVGTVTPATEPGTKYGMSLTITDAFFVGATVTVDASTNFSNVEGGGIAQLAAQVKNTPNQAVAWSVDEAAGGTVDAAGKYTAPLKSGVYHVRAKS